MPIIYDIWADDARLPYYGSAMTTLAERRRKHKALYKRWKKDKGNYCSSFDLFDAVGFDACEFRVIEELPEECTKEQLLWRERWYFENCPCVNQQIPIRTREEILQYHRQYHAEHYTEQRDDILERERQNYAKHRSAKLEYMRQYRARKKAEKINQIPPSALPTTSSNSTPL